MRFLLSGVAIAYVAMGSNLGDRRGYLAAAVDAMARLPETRVLCLSEPFETEPVGPAGQGMYLNATVAIETDLPARAVLDGLLRIERSLGRERRERWGPRTIDLDLLTYDDAIVEEPGLTLPHPRLHERRFVLEPLASIAPDLVIPGRGRVRDLLDRLC